MRKMIEYFIRYPLMGNSIIFVVTIFGLMALFNTRTNFFPDIPSHFIRIVATLPGAAPKEIEEGIVITIEDKLKGVSGVKEITSSSSENSAVINVEVLSNADINQVLIDVENEIDKINNFPASMEDFASYIVENRDPAIDLVIYGNADLKEVKREARKFERMLLAQKGISKVTLYGFPQEEIEIGLTEEKMTAYDITFDQVMRAVQQSNLRITGGTIKGDREDMLIRADSKHYYADELGAIALKKTANGSVVFLRDVADIKGQWKDTPNHIYFNSGKAVWINIQTSNGEDLIAAAEIAKKTLKEFNEKGGNLQADVVIDRSQIIKERIHILTSNGIMGIVLVVLFLGLFLHFRMAFWVSMVIPVALLGVFMVGPLYGFTVNVMSLLGLILVLGLLVDHGIVIAENIYTRFEEGADAISAAVEGTLEVIPSVIGSVLTTMVIFAAFFFLDGGLGDRARDIGFVVIVSLAFSLIEAMFILPGHIAHSKALHRKTEKEKHGFFAWFDAKMNWLRFKGYGPILRFVMKNYHIGIVVPFALFMITIGAIKSGIIQTTFFPPIEFNRMAVTLQMPAGTAEHITDSLLTEIENDIWAVNNDLKKSNGGKSVVTGVLRYLSASHTGEVTAILVPGPKRNLTAKEFGSKVRKETGVVPGAEKISFGSSKMWGSPISIALQGDDFHQLQEVKEKLKELFRTLPELKDISDSDPQGLQEVQITLKPKAYALGLTTQMVMQQVRHGFYGGRAQRIQRGIDEVEVNVRYDESERKNLEELRDMRIRTVSGGSFPLGEVATFSIRRGVLKIGHRDGRSEIVVESDLENPNNAAAMNRRIKTEILPQLQAQYPEVTFNMEGESKSSKETADSAKIVVPLVLFLMYMIVVLTFRSFLQAALVFVLIPVSLTGVFWGHWITSHLVPATYAVTILSMFGIIALLGIIVNDALVLIETMNRNLKTGQDFEEALYNAGVSRFRPVVLTSITTIAGLGPLIFEKSYHAQFLSPMAISVGYGLLYATLLTLLMLPALLVAANKAKQFLHWVWNDEKGLASREFEPAIIEDREEKHV